MVNQFTWKDNVLVLFLSTVFEGHETITRKRRRPATNTATARNARLVFGSEARKQLQIPLFVDYYNHNMNSVDIGDQYRAYNAQDHPIRRGGWQALAWGYLLEVGVVNSFILQSRGQPAWEPIPNQGAWRRALSTALIQGFGPQAHSRQRSRAWRPADCLNRSIPIIDHTGVSRGKNNPCVACSYRAKQQQQQQPDQGGRQPLGEISGNSMNGGSMRASRRRSRWGCQQCDVT